MIISVWALEGSHGSKATDEPEATVTHQWQAELLARECARRYRQHYGLCLNGDVIQIYDARGIVRRVRERA